MEDKNVDVSGLTDSTSDAPKPKKYAHLVSRTAFLQYAGGILGGTALGTLIGRWVQNTHPEVGQKLLEELSISPDDKVRIHEIGAYKKSLGLDADSNDLLASLMENVKWDGEPDLFVDSGPEINHSYSLRVAEVMEALYGKNARRLVKGTKMDDQYPFGISFDGAARLCNISQGIHDIPIQNEFTDFALHEAAGHGTDPWVGARYPFGISVQVEHGKWRALSQAFAIPDQFLNSPGDLTLPRLKRNIGEAVANFRVNGGSSSVVDANSVGILGQTLNEIARKRGKTVDTLKFNKKVCRELGETLVNLKRAGTIQFAGDLKDTYRESLEGACVEIYAEMIKFALVYPDKVNNNPDIAEGVAEVIGAIKGTPIDIETMRKTLVKPSDAILIRNQAEKQTFVTETLLPPTETPTLTPEELALIAQQDALFAQRQLDFENFISQGILPPQVVITDAQKETVDTFCMSYHMVISRYSTLMDTFAQQYDEQFDPELHVWEIREIESAMDSGFVRNLLGCGQVIPDDMITEMQKKNPIIQGFIQSPAF